TVLLEAVTEETEELIVEDMPPFFSDDNPETLDGILLIDGEIIAYAHWVQDMNPDTQSVFYRVQGLLRGAFLSAPRRRDLQHPAGRLVRDARGVKLALHPYWLRLGRYSPFATVAAIRDIASWSLVDPFVASLFRRGYTAQDLHDLGLGGDALESFGATSSLRRARQRAEAANAAEAESEEGEGTDAPEVNLPKKLDPSRAGNIAERVMRAHGRQGGADWLKAVRARTDAKGEALEEFLAAAEKEMNARAEYEESYFSSAADRLSALGSVRDIQVLGAREAGRIKPHLTVHSTRPMEWAGGAIIRNRLEPDPKADQSTLVIGVLVPEARAGAVAKVVGAGGEIEYRQIRGVNRPRKQISLYPQLSGTFGADSARVFCAPAHPVNVNTASREVLRAVFTGVTLAAGRGRQDLVTPREAERLAERVIAQPIEGPEAFRIVLAEAAGAGEISGTDAQALFLNAIDPGHPRLRGRTLPFTFASGGVFTIETTSVVNNPAGVELAREVVREVVSVAPARTAEVYFDSQQDMLYGGNSRLGPVHIPGRRGNLVELSPVPLRTSQLVQWPERSHQPGTGRMRLETGETGSGQGSGVLHVEHYRDELRGQDLGGGMSLDTIPRMDDPYGSWPSEVMAPGWIELWMRPQGSGPFTVFDTGQRDTTDRLVLHYDGQRFIFEAYDASIEPIPCAELQGVVELRAGTWYHIAASWRGTRPGDLALFLDGVKLGSTFDYDSNGRADAPGTAYLTSGIDQNALSIPVDNTAGFPPQGAIRVGTEVIEYDGVSGNSFTVRQDPFPTPLQPGQNAPPPLGRGARGSSARGHGVRTPVTIFGYTNFFVGTIPGAPFSLAQVQRGGATLTHALPALTPMAAL
ncbi:MAG: LamG-like jellyroll fold domain-containing protein, partial [Planctomycetota bacterium]